MGEDEGVRAGFDLGGEAMFDEMEEIFGGGGDGSSGEGSWDGDELEDGELEEVVEEEEEDPGGEVELVEAFHKELRETGCVFGRGVEWAAAEGKGLPCVRGSDQGLLQCPLRREHWRDRGTNKLRCKNGGHEFRSMYDLLAHAYKKGYGQGSALHKALTDHVWHEHGHEMRAEDVVKFQGISGGGKGLQALRHVPAANNFPAQAREMVVGQKRAGEDLTQAGIEERIMKNNFFKWLREFKNGKAAQKGSFLPMPCPWPKDRGGECRGSHVRDPFATAKALYDHARTKTQSTTTGKLQHRILCDWLEAEYPEVLETGNYDNRMEAATAKAHELVIGLSQANKRTAELEKANEVLSTTVRDLQAEIKEKEKELEENARQFNRQWRKFMKDAQSDKDRKVEELNRQITEMKIESGYQENDKVNALRRELQREQKNHERMTRRVEQLEDFKSRAMANFVNAQMQERIDYNNDVEKAFAKDIQEALIPADEDDGGGLDSSSLHAIVGRSTVVDQNVNDFVVNIDKKYTEIYNDWIVRFGKKENIMKEVVGHILPFRRRTGIPDIATVLVAVEHYREKHAGDTAQGKSRNAYSMAIQLRDYLEGLIIHEYFDVDKEAEGTRRTRTGHVVDIKKEPEFMVFPVVDPRDGTRMSWQKAFQMYDRCAPPYEDRTFKAHWRPKDVHEDRFLRYISEEFSAEFAKYILDLKLDHTNYGQPAYSKLVLWRLDKDKCRTTSEFIELKSKWLSLAKNGDSEVCWVLPNNEEVLKRGVPVLLGDFKEGGESLTGVIDDQLRAIVKFLDELGISKTKRI